MFCVVFESSDVFLGDDSFLGRGEGFIKARVREGVDVKEVGSVEVEVDGKLSE